jgi:pyruvate-ferredoxin/flavodoxin oxidoreductase
MLMGSGIGAAQEAVETLVAQGEKVGMIKVRLFRPFAPRTCSRRCRSPPRRSRAGPHQGARRQRRAHVQDVVTAMAEAVADGSMATMPRVVGGRYGLSSKEFTPAMVKASSTSWPRTAEEQVHHRHHRRRQPHQPGLGPELQARGGEGVTECVFYGLGSDGTVSANKNSIKIIGERHRTSARATSSTTPRRPAP